MNWPSMTDYQEAIQNPNICFYDQDLKSGSPVLDALNLPKPITGAFASVYELKTGHSKYAVRCFLKHYDDQENRYLIISSYLSKINLNYFAKFEFLPKGILIKGKWYPILKMEWINGLSLIQYIENNLSNPQALINLKNDFLELTNALNKHSIAHGDLQHGNILISNGKIKLVDYDGMFVPGLDGRISNEIGHHNYQHPKRTEKDFGNSIDNFSSWIIYTSLVALCLDPSIWNRMKGGDEHLLFSKKDFVNPNSSIILNELSNSQNSELKYLSNNIIGFLNYGASQIPILTKGIVNPPNGSNPNFKNLGQNWINDYIDGKQTTQANPLNWISSHKKIKFNSSASFGQIVLFGGTGAILLAFMWGYLGRIPILVNSIGFLCISIMSLTLLSYVTTPEVRKKREINSNILSLEKEIRKLRDEQNKIERELNNLQIRDKKQIDDLKSQKSLLHNKEDHDIKSLNGQMNSEISKINSKINNLTNQENEEIKSNSEKNKIRLINDALKHYEIEAMVIPGIGNGLADILHQHGFHTAADIDKSVTRVPGIGEARASLLFSWRKRQEILCLQWVTPKELKEGESHIRQKYQSIRDSLKNDEKNVRNQFNVKIQNVKNSHTTKYSQIEKQIYDVQINGSQKIKQSSDSIDNLNREITEKSNIMNYQKSLENSSFSEINLSNYLKYLIFMKH